MGFQFGEGLLYWVQVRRVWRQVKEPAAVVAQGKIKNQESFPVLLELIKESETNENVRLVARKSLKALAGGVDRGYDVELWQRLFQRK